MQNSRMTPARKAMINIFTNAKRPVSALQMLAELKKRQINVNKTTVYRELAFLLKNNIIGEVVLVPGTMHYESSLLNHHHHLICTSCGGLEDVDPLEIEGSMEKLEKRVRQEGFTISRHSLEFYGLCQNCV